MTKQVNLMEPQTGLDTDRVKQAIDLGKLAENRPKTGTNLSSDYTYLTNLTPRRLRLTTIHLEVKP